MRRIVFAFAASLLLYPLLLTAQPVPIVNSVLDGKVADKQTQAGLAGADVRIKGTTHQVLTDDNGKFNFITGQKFPYILTITYVGYKSLEVTVDKSPATITLDPLPKQLGDVVVVGYGTQKRSDLTGSVSKINPQDVRTIPEAGFDAQLQGKAPGVQINSNTGVPGSDVFIRVRGATSINASNDPLYVVDGVVINNVSLQNIAQDRATSPLADINPNDIESIEVLKDASAIAIYGARGANGVIIITTKKGDYGEKAKIDFNASAGIGWAPKDKVWKTTTGPEHAMLVNEYNANMGTPQPFRPATK